MGINLGGVGEHAVKRQREVGLGGQIPQRQAGIGIGVVAGDTGGGTAENIDDGVAAVIAANQAASCNKQNLHLQFLIQLDEHQHL